MLLSLLIVFYFQKTFLYVFLRKIFFVVKPPKAFSCAFSSLTLFFSLSSSKCFRWLFSFGFSRFVLGRSFWFLFIVLKPKKPFVFGIIFSFLAPKVFSYAFLPLFWVLFLTPNRFVAFSYVLAFLQAKNQRRGSKGPGGGGFWKEGRVWVWVQPQSNPVKVEPNPGSWISSIPIFLSRTRRV